MLALVLVLAKILLLLACEVQGIDFERGVSIDTLNLAAIECPLWRKCAMVVMATPDMQTALLSGLDFSTLLNRTGFRSISVALLHTYLESLLSEICHRTLLALLQSFWFFLISEGDAATAGKLRGTKTLYRPSAANVELVRLKMEVASVKENLESCYDKFLKGITSEHHYFEGMSNLLPVLHKPAFQYLDCKSADGNVSGEISFLIIRRLEESKQFSVLSMSPRTRSLSNDMEEENDLTGSCKARSVNESIEGLLTVHRIPMKETTSWMLAAKNKDDDEDEEDEDEEGEDEDEDEDAEGDDNDGGEGDDEEQENEDRGEEGDDGHADKDEEDDVEDDEEGDDEEDEDDEDIDEESSSDEDESPPKKMRK